jgi:hypothetical protein
MQNLPSLGTHFLPYLELAVELLSVNADHLSAKCEHCSSEPSHSILHFSDLMRSRSIPQRTLRAHKS